MLYGQLGARQRLAREGEILVRGIERGELKALILPKQLSFKHRSTILSALFGQRLVLLLSVFCLGIRPIWILLPRLGGPGATRTRDPKDTPPAHHFHSLWRGPPAPSRTHMYLDPRKLLTSSNPYANMLSVTC